MPQFRIYERPFFQQTRISPGNPKFEVELKELSPYTTCYAKTQENKNIKNKEKQFISYMWFEPSSSKVKCGHVKHLT